MFFSRLEELFPASNENYTPYRIKHDRLAQQPQGSFSGDTLTKYGNDCVDYISNFLLAQVFHAATQENVRHLISHRD